MHKRKDEFSLPKAHLNTVEALMHKRSPRKFKKVVVTRAGHLQEWALISDRIVKQ